MSRIQLPTVKTKRGAWNKGRLIGQERPLLPKQVWAIRTRLELARNLRDLALFDLAIDCKLRGCDLVNLTVSDLVLGDRVREGGFDALVDRSPRPKSAWNRIPDEIRADVVEFALEHEDLTPRELGGQIRR